MRKLHLVPILVSGCTIHARTCNNSTFLPLLPSNVTLNYAIRANGTFGGDSKNIPYPHPATQLPPLCVVSVNVASSKSSSYNFGLFLPDDWNERFIATGNGGFAGGIKWPTMGQLSQYGFASLSTDTGHSSKSTDASWALNKPESMIDWGYRAMHGSVELGKQLTEAYYDSTVKFSYYSGCSTGGRQGLKEAQMFPDDFDGIIAGAPAWWTSHLQPWTVYLGLQNLASNSETHIPISLLKTIQTEVIHQCDTQDGVADGIVTEPDTCNFWLEALLCRSEGNSSDCLSQPQLDTLHQLYSNWVDGNGTLLFPALALGADLSSLAGGTVHALGSTYIENFILNTTDWDPLTFDSSLVWQADVSDPGYATISNFDLSSFRDRGGKVIMYHGILDDLIPVGSSVHFYKQVSKTMGSSDAELDGFFKLFLIPGMEHCAEAAVAPWYIAAAGQEVNGAKYSVPGYSDARHDAILAIMDWVEHGKEPDSIIATKFHNDDSEQGIFRQRPVCAYPVKAKYDGTGSIDRAESWSCEKIRS